jgi:hypothetical protein
MGLQKEPTKAQKETSKARVSKASVTLLGRVEKILPPAPPSFPERAQIVIEEADHMYREIRVENKLVGIEGKPCRLKLGAEVDIRIEADLKWTAKKTELN